MKKILPFILALTILSGCAAGTEVTETSGTSGTVTTAEKSETTVTETTTVTTETTEVTAEAEEASIIDSIKEALKAEWSNNVDYVQMYAEDLNGDGIKELFVNYSPKLSNKCGVTHIFDVSDGVKKLYKISLMTAKGYLYTDESGGVHYIIRTGYSDGMDRSAYYDVAYDSIEIPFYADTKGVDDVKVYKNCKVVPNTSLFSSSNAEFVGNFDRKNLHMAWFDEEINEISELVQSEVFDGLTYSSEAALVYLGKGFENFEDFIKEAEPKLELVYGDAKPADTSDVDYIKEALKAEWNDDVRVANLYTVDLNGDGVKELFVNYSLGVAMNGFVYVYDVSDGVKKLYEIPARIWASNAGLYKDNYEKTHVIMENGYGSMSLSEQDYAVFNIAYDELKQPLFADVYDWYNGGAHIHEYDLYKNCEIVPDAKVFDGWRNFDPEKAEYIGRYDLTDVWKAFDKQEENEIREIIQKEVYEGMTYISDMEELYSDSGYTADSDTAWDFEYFWQGAAPILSEVYGDTASDN